MLFGEPTKKGAGIILWGDYKDLENLYKTVSDLSDVIGPGTLGDFVLGLCYDIRHAYQGDRETIKFDMYDLTKVKYYGAKILWPYFIIQVGLLRHAAGYTPTNTEVQSNLYRLEYLTGSALKKASPSAAEECIDWLKHFRSYSNHYLVSFLNEITYRFVFDETIHKSRINRLSKVLEMTHEFSNEYKKYYENLSNIAAKKGCKPNELEDEKEWPEFTW